MIDLPAISLIVAAAAVSSLGPVTIGVFLLLASSTLGKGATNARLTINLMGYIFAVFVFNFTLAIALMFALNVLPIKVGEYFSYLLSFLLVAAGLLEIKDYFWYNKALSIRLPQKVSHELHKKFSVKQSALHALSHGFSISAKGVSTMSLALVSIATSLRNQFNGASVLLIALYSLVFILPLFVMSQLLIHRVKVSVLVKWKEESKGAMRLYHGLLLIGLGWIMLLIGMGAISLG